MRLKTRLARLFSLPVWRLSKAGYAHTAFTFRFRYRPRFLAWYHGRSLRLIMGKADTPARNSILAVVPYFGSQGLLRRFIDYHRRLGVTFFVFLDLSREGLLAKELADEVDVAVWRPTKFAVKPSLHWLNFLRGKYATDRWCLSIDATDFFVFPRCETRHLRDLIEILSNEGRLHLYAVVVEAYGVDAAVDIDAHQDVFAAMPYFDGLGYDAESIPRFRGVVTRGGVQRRTLFQQDPKLAPALDRIPLVKWKQKFCYISDTRLLTPRHLNSAHARTHCSPTGCILRFALLNDNTSLVDATTAETTSLVQHLRSQSYAGLMALRHQRLKVDQSIRYTSSQDLIDCGLMSPGQWF